MTQVKVHHAPIPVITKNLADAHRNGECDSPADEQQRHARGGVNRDCHGLRPPLAGSRRPLVFAPTYAAA